MIKLCNIYINLCSCCCQNISIFPMFRNLSRREGRIENRLFIWVVLFFWDIRILGLVGLQIMRKIQWKKVAYSLSPLPIIHEILIVIHLIYYFYYLTTIVSSNQRKQPEVNQDKPHNYNIILLQIDSVRTSDYFD